MVNPKHDALFRAIAVLVALAALAVVGVRASERYNVRSFDDAVALFAAPCERPIEYSLGAVDERFGISRTVLQGALGEAASLWNTEAGRTFFVFVPEGGIPVNLVYTEHQKNAELGSAIDKAQAAYDAKRAEVESLRSAYQTLVASYEAKGKAYESAAAAYDTDVAYWNARGGAPPAEYASLEKRRAELKRKETELNALAARLNVAVDGINARIEELNELAKATNQNVNTYNAAAGDDFDQGNYIEDKDGKRINIFEFTTKTELKRVLAHELGHALGLEHVENPNSIMYSYNVGASLKLSPEDIAAVQARCNIKQ